MYVNVAGLVGLTELGGVPAWQVFDQSHRVLRHLPGLPLDQLLQTSHHSPPQAQEGAAQVGLQHTQAFYAGAFLRKTATYTCEYIKY